MATIRHARPEDASAVADVWNSVIRDTTITFDAVARSPEDVGAMLLARTAAGHPWLVAETAAGVVGFATYAQFRSGSGYARTMEHSIILAASATGRGLGTALLARLVEEAGSRGAASLIAAISGDNPRARAFHAARGFAEVGRIPDAGCKFDRWFDLFLMQRRLG